MRSDRAAENNTCEDEKEGRKREKGRKPEGSYFSTAPVRCCFENQYGMLLFVFVVSPGQVRVLNLKGQSNKELEREKKGGPSGEKQRTKAKNRGASSILRGFTPPFILH